MRLSWIGLLAVVALGCGTPRGADPGVETEAIKSLLERHRRAIEAEDITTIAQGFDRGGPLVVLFGSGAPMTDWMTIESAYRDWFASADSIRVVDSDLRVRVDQSGDAAWASYSEQESATADGKRTTETVRGTLGLAKGADGWKVVQAHWSTTAPPTPIQ